MLDLGVGPVLLEVPEADGRYYVLQFVSAWTDNFAYIGHRATGTRAGRYLLVPPGWEGEAPAEALVVRVPTRIASIIGRWAVQNEADLPAVHALQDATTLTVLDAQAVPAGIPQVSATGSEAQDFWAKFRAYSQAFAPASRDARVQAAAMEHSAPGQLPAAELEEAFAQGRAVLEQALASGGGNAPVNGWNLTYHSFDYNLDYFEVGSLDEEAFKIADPQQRLVQRAAAALGGLWGNQAFEAAYIAAYVDQNQEQLTGERSYQLHLAPTPPVGAFWSLTMYDVPNYFLVENPINRYSLGDRTEGLQFEDDGSLVIHISHAEPADPAQRANWLPAPAGAFRPVLRMYEPKPQILDLEYTFPAITRIDQA